MFTVNVIFKIYEFTVRFFFFKFVLVSENVEEIIINKILDIRF